MSTPSRFAQQEIINALHFPTVQKEMKLILPYIDEGNLTAFQAFSRGASISLFYNISLFKYPQSTNCCTPKDKCVILFTLLDHPYNYISP